MFQTIEVMVAALIEDIPIVFRIILTVVLLGICGIAFWLTN